MAGPEESIKVPLKWRMKAWWEGYDLDDVKVALASGGDVEEELKNPSPVNLETETRELSDNP
ncbi:MAG: hypothetical protein P8I94_09160, partial [Emcibacteraceae bacterium]|nr:hypothetical protein [Emcibacteraceae bacterium]